MKHYTYQTPSPTCPHCGHEMDTDDMLAAHGDLFGIAPDEGCERVTCPSCAKKYWVQGGYRPYYTSAIKEDDL